MTVGRATAADIATLEELCRAAASEDPRQAHPQSDVERLLADVPASVEEGLAFVARRDGATVGIAVARRSGERRARIGLLYVVPGVRREGVAAMLLRALADALDAAGIDAVDLVVSSANPAARSVVQHWGFEEQSVHLAAPVAGLADRLAPDRHAVSFASIHVQTDDVSSVERAAAAFAPRIGSRAWRVEGPRDGWTTVYDEVVDRDPTALVRFAREVSSRLGAVVVALSLELDRVVRLVALERGGIVDEYLSVPEFYGPMAPGDVIGLAANPTVLHRLTGADPDRVREVARTAATPDDLPPAAELLDAIASVLGLAGAGYGYAERLS